MKCLLLHCKKFSYQLNHPTSIADTEINKKEDSFKDALVVFLAIEKGDNEQKVKAAASEISKLAKLIKPNKIVINPFAHLSSTLAPAAEAKKLSQKLAADLKEIFGFKTSYTSFGWYKSFTLDAYGSDNSQLFREF